ncbi:MAG: hypothetical protein ABWY03_07705 [Microbacterium sp.]
MSSTLRFTGIAALVAAGVHLLQFLVLGIGPVLDEPDFPVASRAGENFWFGLAGTATFTIIAIAYLAFFSAGTALTRRDDAHDAIWRTAMQTAAGIGIGGWLLAGATNLARRGFNATAIDAAAGGDAAIGRAVLQGAYLTTSAAAIASALAFAIWFVAFAVRGVRAGAFGWLVGATAVVTGILPVAGWAVDIGGVPVILVGLLVIGPALLARAKRTAVTTVVVAQ